MKGYKKGDKVVVVDHYVKNKNIHEKEKIRNWGYSRRTFYVQVKSIDKSAYADNTFYRLVNLDFLSNGTIISGMFEDNTEMRKINFLECLFYDILSRRSFPEQMFYLDKMLF